MEKQVTEVLERQRVADDRMGDLRGEMRRLIDRAIVSSRQIETESREETLREHALRELRILYQSQPLVDVDDLVTRLQKTFPISRVINELRKMKQEGVIELKPDAILPDAEIRLVGSLDKKTED